MHPCARCASVQRTCCQRAEILVTDGDLARIRAASARGDFTEFRAPVDPAYLEHDPADPDWLDLTLRSDGTRRMLRRSANGDCIFLGERGCVLDEATRPIVCRLYPYSYDAGGIRAEEPEYCPTLLLTPPGGSMATLLEMSRVRAEGWRELLYRELRADLATREEGTSCASV